MERVGSTSPQAYVYSIVFPPILQAYDARDALAKAFYGKLFSWIVATVNAHIKCDRKDVKAFVGVLDIFGFECFQRNRSGVCSRFVFVCVMQVLVSSSFVR